MTSKKSDSTNSSDSADVAEKKTMDAGYFSCAFETIASLAGRCLNEPGIKSHDIIWAIQKMAESFAAELDGEPTK